MHNGTLLLSIRLKSLSCTLFNKLFLVQCFTNKSPYFRRAYSFNTEIERELQLAFVIIVIVVDTLTHALRVPVCACCSPFGLLCVRFFRSSLVSLCSCWALCSPIRSSRFCWCSSRFVLFTHLISQFRCVQPTFVRFVWNTERFFFPFIFPNSILVTSLRLDDSMKWCR